MIHDPQMDTLPDAIAWLRSRWDEQRTAPTRLTVHDTDGELGGLRFSGAFAATLAWQPGQSRRMERTRVCGHPMSRGDAKVCPECSGVGVKSVLVDAYTYPMTLALRRLARAKGEPRPLSLVYALAVHGWRPTVALRVMGVPGAEHLLLRAIRQLHGRYAEGPVAWTRLSQSAQNAVIDGESEVAA